MTELLFLWTVPLRACSNYVIITERVQLDDSRINASLKQNPVSFSSWLTRLNSSLCVNWSWEPVRTGYTFSLPLTSFVSRSMNQLEFWRYSREVHTWFTAWFTHVYSQLSKQCFISRLLNSVMICSFMPRCDLCWQNEQILKNKLFYFTFYIKKPSKWCTIKVSKSI